MATIAQLLAQRECLQGSSDSAAVDAEYLLCHCLDKPRSYLRGWADAEVPEAAEQQFLRLLERRRRGEPIAYLIGRGGFWTLDLETSDATLIPRPDTELLVELVLKRFGDRQQLALLDLGTGTGAIALALASERPHWHIEACDVEPAAVALATSNRDRLGLGQVDIVQSDWFAAIARRDFDVIVSNPPYIDADDPHLALGDVRFEPRSALVSGAGGFADIEHIVDAARHYLAPQGCLLFEHGYNQGEGARRRLARAGYQQVFTARDLAGHERVSGGCWSATAEQQEPL